MQAMLKSQNCITYILTALWWEHLHHNMHVKLERVYSFVDCLNFGTQNLKPQCISGWGGVIQYKTRSWEIPVLANALKSNAAVYPKRCEWFTCRQSCVFGRSTFTTATTTELSIVLFKKNGRIKSRHWSACSNFRIAVGSGLALEPISFYMCQHATPCDASVRGDSRICLLPPRENINHTSRRAQPSVHQGLLSLQQRCHGDVSQLFKRDASAFVLAAREPHSS